jgi:predicted DNA-binding transcriptional regulator AlpA
MLGIAPTTLWRWLKDLPDFPQPERYRLAGRNVTVWYVDDLEAWMAKQSDMAWRRNAPAAAVPLFTPAGLDAGQRGLWCAYLLDLSPFEVFPFGATSDPAGSQHLFEHLTARVAQLRADAPEPNPTNAELTGYLRTLAHCADVLAGRVPPEVRGPRGFENAGKYRRGVYVFPEVSHDD